MTPPAADSGLPTPDAPPAATARFLVLYTTPSDPDAFDRHYQQVHLPLAKHLPGLRRYSLSREVTLIRGAEPYYLIAQLEWDDLAALRAAFASPEGRATAEDMTHLTALSTVSSMIYQAHAV